jgi:membrane-bound ClpP family serine protease
VALVCLGRNSVSTAASISATLSTPRVGIVLLVLGALCIIVSTLTGMCRVQPSIAYGSAAVLALTALGIGIGWMWARQLGRVIAWLNVFVFAMLIVPDREDAVLTDFQGLHVACGVIAAYFVLCAVILGLRSRRDTGE